MRIVNVHMYENVQVYVRFVCVCGMCVVSVYKVPRFRVICSRFLI